MSISLRDKKIPIWFKKNFPYNDRVYKTRTLLKELNLNTVCEKAKCPNIGNCFADYKATFLILGNICTRHCKFCFVDKGKPITTDNLQEIEKIITATKKLNMKYIIITSVTRDDLKDFGAKQFIVAIKKIKELNSNIKIEILTPDFMGKTILIKNIATIKPDVFSHNLETVPRLYPQIRPEADYKRSLKVLEIVKETNSAIFTKSSLLLGLGETMKEVFKVMKDLREIRCNGLSLGQYLRPSSNQIEVDKYIKLEIFEKLKEKAYEMGFDYVTSAPFVRSSYKAEEFIFNLKT